MDPCGPGVLLPGDGGVEINTSTCVVAHTVTSLSSVIYSVPLSPSMSYYEVTILNGGPRKTVCVGASRPDYDMSNAPGAHGATFNCCMRVWERVLVTTTTAAHPASVVNAAAGWRAGSVGFHCDDGKLYNGSTPGTVVGRTSDTGDRLGCGAVFRGKSTVTLLASFAPHGSLVTRTLCGTCTGATITQIYFTRNGALVKRVDTSCQGVHPHVALAGPGEQVQFNFAARSPVGAGAATASRRVDPGPGALLPGDGRVEVDAGSCMAYVNTGPPKTASVMYSVPLSPALAYYEVRIVNGGTGCEVGVGLSQARYNMSQHPGACSPGCCVLPCQAHTHSLMWMFTGWRTGSIGYHTDNGKLYSQRPSGQAYGPTSNTGDVIGCGADFEGAVRVSLPCTLVCFDVTHPLHG